MKRSRHSECTPFPPCGRAPSPMKICLFVKNMEMRGVWAETSSEKARAKEVRKEAFPRMTCCSLKRSPSLPAWWLKIGQSPKIEA